jgi:hypothetical protein
LAYASSFVIDNDLVVILVGAACVIRMIVDLLLLSKVVCRDAIRGMASVAVGIVAALAD